ncbi:MAG: SIS domain-containing protein [Chloroflexota bacterium]
MTHLAREINEQPERLTDFLTSQRETVAAVAAAIRGYNPASVMIAARGTSDNAARYAQYIMGAHLQMPVGLSAPSLHTIYGTPPKLSRHLVIGISQSGQARDVNAVLEDANRDGALTVAITNYPDSPMATTAQHHIWLNVGPEVSIAATKTYTAQLAAVALLTASLADDPALITALEGIPAVVRQTLTYSEAIEQWAPRYRYMTQFASIGRGFNYCTAFEIGLKVKELTSVIGEGYSEADFRHGPIATISNGFPVILVAPAGKVSPQLRDLITKLQEKRAELLIVGNEDDLLSQAANALRIPAVDEWLSPIAAVVPGQIFAMHQAIVRGLPVDKPEGLQKVTITE